MPVLETCPHCRAGVPAGAERCPACGELRPEPDGDERPDPALLERLGRALGPKYTVQGRVGRGSFCDVFAVWDHPLERRLAVKVLRTDLPWGPGLRARFEREARALAMLGHINIPPVHFVGDREGLAYFAMPFVEGESLAERFAREGPLEPRRLVELMVPILDALAHAHRHGIVHRDVTPANIVVETATGRPLLMDFGVARDLQARAGASLPGVVVGTPPYASPEQLLGEAVDHRSDVYAVGSTMFHLLTGRLPGQEAPDSIPSSRVPPPSPSQVNPRVPPWLSSVVLCALEYAPDARYQSAAAMADALRAGLRAEAEAPREWVEPSFVAATVLPSLPHVSAAPLELAGQGSTAPWLRVGEAVPLQAERWAIQLRWLLALVVISFVVTWILLVPLRLVMENHLAVPVVVRPPGREPVTLEPGQVFDLRVGSEWRAAVPWEIPGSQAPGQAEPVRGVLRVEALSLGDLFTRRIRRDIDLWQLSDLVLAPRVVNASRQPVRVVVRDGASVRAAATVPAGTEDLLGYYRWSDGFRIEVEADGHRLDITPRLSEVNRETGVFPVRVTDASLARVEGGAGTGG